MSYTIRKSDGSALTTIQDFTTDNTTSLTLVGRGVANYGLFVASDFVQVLENFAANTPPANPLQGQLWWDKTGAGTLKVYTGTIWRPMGSTFVTAATGPASYNPSAVEPVVDGLLRYNTTLDQLQVQSGGLWRTTGDYSSLMASGAYGHEQDPDGSPAATSQLGQNFPVRWSDTAATVDINGAPATGKYLFSDGDDSNPAYRMDLGGIDLVRENQNGGNPFNARFASIHSMNFRVYDSVLPGANYNKSTTNVGTMVSPFDAVAGKAVQVQTLLEPFANNIPNIGSTTKYFNNSYIRIMNADSAIVTSATLAAGNITTLTVKGNGSAGNAIIQPSHHNVYDIGTTTNKFRNAYVSGTYYGGDFNGNNFIGNLGDFQNLTVHGSINALGGISGIDSSSFYKFNQNNSPTSDNTFNLGDSSHRFSNVYATTFQGTATAANYADLAERYAVSGNVGHGDVVMLGGEKEITKTTEDRSIDVFGVISTDPAFRMNDGAGSDISHPFVALSGRVPCKVVGPVAKGQRLTTSNTPGVARAMDTVEAKGNILAIIGRAIENKTTDEIGLVEIVVGVK